MAAPYKRTAPGATGGGVYVGTVTRVVARTCFVEIPALGMGLEYGPARYPADLHVDDVAAVTAPAGGHAHGDAGGHSHTVDVDDSGTTPITRTTSVDGAHAHPAAADHTHPLDVFLDALRANKLAAGDSVAVAFLGNRLDDVVVLARLA